MAAHEQIDAGATGFVCASDTMAMGVLRAFDERSMQAGRDVGVVGFDDSAAAQVTGLSSVRQPLEQVAVELVGLLRAALDGVADPRLRHRAHPHPRRTHLVVAALARARIVPNT